MRIEAMPVIGIGDGIPAPVGGFKILEDNACAIVLLGGVTPDIKMAPDMVWPGATRALKPGVLIGGVVEHQLGNHLQPAPVRCLQEDLEVMQGTIRRMDIRVV